MKIHYAGQQGEGWGWGCFGANMVKQWRAMGVYTVWPRDPDCLFHVATNPDFAPMDKARAPLNFGMAFFESELGADAAANASQYDVLFVGSTWCKERCAERGITNTEVLIQGVDRSIFKPGPHRLDADKPYWPSVHERAKQFRIFSGGKFEYRKGQDLVIAAFREFAKDHLEAHLVCSWFNPWPHLIPTMIHSPHLHNPSRAWATQEEYFAALLEGNGLHCDQFTILPQLNQADLAREMANTDCGLFPNRCEGGTNLVLMEYAACGGSVIANLGTGHADIAALVEHDIEFKEDNNHWAWSDPTDDIQYGLQDAYYDRTTFPDKPIPTWEAAAQQVLTRAEECLQAKSHDYLGTRL